MPEPTSCACCYARSNAYCDRRDLLVGLPGLRVIKVVADRWGGGLIVTVESPSEPIGCPTCGTIAASHGRRTDALVLLDSVDTESRGCLQCAHGAG
jgi:hypothetical protein